MIYLNVSRHIFVFFRCFTDIFTRSWVNLFHVKHYLVSIIQIKENVSRETCPNVNL